MYIQARGRMFAHYSEQEESQLKLIRVRSTVRDLEYATRVQTRRRAHAL
jgi:hypothetical protein